MRLREIIIFSIIISQIIQIHTRCGTNKHNIKPTINKAMKIDEEKDFRFLQNQPWEEFKIFIDFTFIDSQKGKVDADMIDFAKKITEQTVKLFTTLLKIQRSSSNKIKLNEACGNVELNQMSKDLTTTGIEADIVIIPMFDTTAEASTEAYASPCSLDPNNYRPIVGVMAFNPKNFQVKMKNTIEYYIMLVVHEINHILSFNDTLFDYFINPSTNKPLGRANIIKKVTINGIERSLITTPKVLEMAKKHFNCQSLQGVELENQGGEGSAGSHWEARSMLGDFMIAETYPENVISEITLALFEDSGWYKVNWYTGGLFRYGKNEGCDFLTKKCIIDGKTNFPNTFCLAGDKQICFANKLAKGVCDLGVLEKPLEAKYQYFSDANTGGYLFADYCPVARWGWDSVNEMFFSNSCALGNVNYGDLGEKIDSSSSCFMSSLIPKDVNNFQTLQGKNRAICYPITCNKADKTYSVKVLNVTINCPKEGGKVTNSEMDGSFYCPDYNKICTKSSPCKDPIECVLNKVSYEEQSYDYTPKSELIDYNSPPISSDASPNNNTPNNNTPNDNTPKPNTSSNSNRYQISLYLICSLIALFI